MDKDLEVAVRCTDGALRTGLLLHADGDIVVIGRNEDQWPHVVPTADIKELLYKGHSTGQWYAVARSARQWQRTYNGQKAASRAGGTTHLIKAIYDGNDDVPERRNWGVDDEAVIPAELCKVLPLDEDGTLYKGHNLRHWAGTAYPHKSGRSGTTVARTHELPQAHQSPAELDNLLESRKAREDLRREKARIRAQKRRNQDKEN